MTKATPAQPQQAENERLLQALDWYSSMAKRMGDAAIQMGSQAMLALMKELSVDYGKRAALAKEGE